MTQYFFVDESGDAGLEGQAGSSSHFVVTIVQLPNRMPLRPLVNCGKHYIYRLLSSSNITKPQELKKIASSKMCCKSSFVCELRYWTSSDLG